MDETSAVAAELADRQRYTMKSLGGCARCGETHYFLEFRKFQRPIEDTDGQVWTHWAPCPTTGDPIPMAFINAPSGENSPNAEPVRWPDVEAANNRVPSCKGNFSFEESDGYLEIRRTYHEPAKDKIEAIDGHHVVADVHMGGAPMAELITKLLNIAFSASAVSVTEHGA